MKKGKLLKGGVRGQSAFFIPSLGIAFATFLLFWLYPNLSSFLLAFQDMQGQWATINFTQFFESLTATDGDLKISALNTLLYFSAGVFIRLPLVVFVCYFLYKKIWGYRFFRIMFYMSAIIPVVALTGIFKEFIASMGPLGKLCDMLGIPLANEGLLAQVSTATPTILFYEIWTCFASCILLINGGMSRIPTEIIESAKIEGCGPFREIVQFIIPLIWPTLSTLIILSCTSILSAGANVLLLQPDNQYHTSTISYWMFSQMYGNGNYGGTGRYGIVSATGLCFTAVVVPFALIVKWLLEKIPAVEY